MTSVHCIAVGRVKKISDVAPQTGKPFLAIQCEMSPRSYNGKSYTERFEVKVYGDSNIAALAEVNEGDWITAFGSGKAETHEWQGKTYGKLVITGKAEAIQNAAASQVANQPAPVAQAGPPKTLAQKTREPVPKDDDSGDVPF